VKGAHGESGSAGTRIWGQSPQWGPGAEPLVGGSGVALKLKSFRAFGRENETANLPSSAVRRTVAMAG